MSVAAPIRTSRSRNCRQQQAGPTAARCSRTLWRRRRTHWLRRSVGGLLQLLRGRIGGLLRFFHRVLSRLLRFFAKLLELRLRFLNLFVGSFLCLFGFAF